MSFAFWYWPHEQRIVHMAQGKLYYTSVFNLPFANWWKP